MKQPLIISNDLSSYVWSRGLQDTYQSPTSPRSSWSPLKRQIRVQSRRTIKKTSNGRGYLDICAFLTGYISSQQRKRETGEGATNQLDEFSLYNLLFACERWYLSIGHTHLILCRVNAQSLPNLASQCLFLILYSIGCMHSRTSWRVKIKIAGR